MKIAFPSYARCNCVAARAVNLYVSDRLTVARSQQLSTESFTLHVG